MRRPLDFDPSARSYGPATSSVRDILRAWGEIAWFEPGSRNPIRAAQRFAEHHARGRLHLPEAFPASFAARLATGGWDDFAALAAEVRRPEAWSWKYGPLKKLSLAHKQAKRWTPEENLASLEEPTTPPRPGDLFFRIGGSVIWTGLGQKSDPPPAGHEELVSWYLQYADMDALFAIEWQLANRSDDTSDNPFLPLLDCYAAGVLPFGRSPEDFVLFALRAPPKE